MSRAPRPSFVEVHEACPSCRLDGALVVLWEGGGLQVSAECRLCGLYLEEGRELRSGLALEAESELKERIAQWAVAEGASSVEEFVQESIGMADLDTLLLALRAAKQRGNFVESQLDSLPSLFSGGGGGAPREATPKPEVRPIAPTQNPAQSDAWIGRCALSTVLLADGLVRPREARWFDRWCAERGLPRIAEDPPRSWFPGELPHPTDHRPIILDMARLAHIDAERDGSEWRVCRAFARYWGFPLGELERVGDQEHAARSPLPIRLFRFIFRLFRKPKPQLEFTA